MTIKEVKEYLLTIDNINRLDQDALNMDSRVGVKKAIASRRRHLEKELKIKQRYTDMNQFEDALRGRVVCGIDEAGRGPLAGEVIASAVVLGETELLGLDDSKKLNSFEKQRLYHLIQETCQFGIGVATVEEIDALNIYEATKLAMRRAVDNLEIDVDYMLVDAMTLNNGILEKSIVKGDCRSNSIAAASVIAKVYRDYLMQKHSANYPEYGFEHNSGYGTKSHLEALKKYGATPLHRKSFAPVQNTL